MKARPISPELAAALKRVRLGRMLPTLPERIALAEKDGTPFDELLLVLVTDEIERRKSTAAARRADEAGLDPDMVVERWDKTAKVHFDKRVFQELCSLRFIEDARNVVILGPVGVQRHSWPAGLDTSPAAAGSTSASTVPMPCCGSCDRAGSITRETRSWPS